MEAITVEVEQILEDLKGQVGERKKKNLETLRRRIFAGFEEGGETTTAMKALVDFGSSV